MEDKSIVLKDKNKHDEAERMPAPDQNNEEVSSDYLDDFLNADFMEGLDIVDTWEEETQAADSSKIENKNKSKSENTGSKGGKKEDIKKKQRITYKSRSRERKSREQHRDLRDKLKCRARNEEESKSKRSRIEDRRKQIGRNRRDPVKTRRDILRDKSKCAKDKEVKIINEKLKIVETGLVPPGMEMEVDLKKLCKKQDILKKPENVKNRGNFKCEESGKSAKEVKESRCKYCFTLLIFCKSLKPREICWIYTNKMATQNTQFFSFYGA